MDEESFETTGKQNEKPSQPLPNRRKQNDNEYEVRRSLADLQLNSTDVTAIIEELKVMSSISVSKLHFLQNALAEDPKYVELLLNTHGTLQGLVRELSDQDVSKQIASCCCLCNLAYVDSKACWPIAKLAGTYLITCLGSSNSELAMTCASTLSILFGARDRACEVLVAQGAAGALSDALRNPRLLDEATCACANLAYVMKDKLPSEHLRQIILSLSQVESDFTAESSQLLSILSSHKDFTPQTLPQEYLKKILEKIPISIENHIAACIDPTTTRYENKKCCEMKYLIRVIIDVNNYDVYSILLNSLIGYEMIKHIRRLLDLDDKTMWLLLANIVRCCGNHPFMFYLNKFDL